MVEGKIKEQGLAGDWLKVGRELDQIGLFSNKGRVEAEGFQSVAEWLHEGGRNGKGELCNHRMQQIHTSHSAMQPFKAHFDSMTYFSVATRYLTKYIAYLQKLDCLSN